jgi:cytochrome d ubiquinol oxidase subunit I
MDFVLAASSQLAPARSQMAFTLGFHIVLSCMGVAFPLITLVANWRGVFRDDEDALTLAKRWSKVMAVLFAVGAVTGTVLSFELGLLWPGLFDRYGDVFGVSFAVEGIFFFTEAIFIAIYIYGWKRLPPRAHFYTGIPIVVAGLGGALAVVAANSWMNQPGGFTTNAAGEVTSVDAWKVIFNRATPYEVPHMILAAYMVAGFLVASVYAAGMLRGRTDRYHRVGFAIPFVIASIATPIQLLVGDTAARAIANDQPAKFASMEYVTKTGPKQTEWIGGVFQRSTGDVKFGVGIPDLDSILVGFSPNTVVTGLDQVPKNNQPPFPTLLHLAFDTMVGIGTALLLLGLWAGWAYWRRRALPASKWFLRAGAVSGVAAVLALECGWIVTEVGRQPWIVYNRLRTADAVTTAGGIYVSFTLILLLYAALGVTTVLILRLMAQRWRSPDAGDDVEDVPYGPREDRMVRK